MIELILGLSQTSKQVLIFAVVFLFVMSIFLVLQFARFNYGTMRRGGLLDLVGNIPAQVLLQIIEKKLNNFPLDIHFLILNIPNSYPTSVMHTVSSGSGPTYSFRILKLRGASYSLF